MKLYVIGNGFDLAHNLKTKYTDYRDFIKTKLRTNYKWDTILNFYPENYEFWSDIEYNVCKIDKELFSFLKNSYRFGFLDDLFRYVYESFHSFILGVESKVCITKPYFTLDTNSIFLTFNYTTTLETVYKVSKRNIIHIHNDIGGGALELLYGVKNNSPCIIGHSPFAGDYAIEDINDKEYVEYVEKTTKQCDKNITEKHIIDFLLKHKKDISEIVFYGFSFSITDKSYVRMIFTTFNDSAIKTRIYYKIKNKHTDSEEILSIKNKIRNSGIDPDKFEFINCDGARTI